MAEYYDSEISTVSWVGSLFLGVRTIFGPITGGLIKMFGLRSVCISGSIVLAIGLLLSPLSPNIPILMLSQGRGSQRMSMKSLKKSFNKVSTAKYWCYKPKWWKFDIAALNFDQDIEEFKFLK